MFTPTPEQFFANRGQDRTKPDVAFLKNHFYREGRVTEDQALWILEQGTELLKKEQNVLQVDAPITGQYLSLAELSRVAKTVLHSVWRRPRSICACRRLSLLIMPSLIS
jgi:serine/threonine-protein phosphatase 2B catalytic subunit